MSAIRIRMVCEIEMTGQENLADERELRLLVEQQVALALLEIFDEVAVELVEVTRAGAEGGRPLPFRRRQGA